MNFQRSEEVQKYHDIYFGGPRADFSAAGTSLAQYVGGIDTQAPLQDPLERKALEEVPTQNAIAEAIDSSTVPTDEELLRARRAIGQTVLDLIPNRDAQQMFFSANILRNTSPPPPRNYVEEARRQAQIAAEDRAVHYIPGEPQRLARRR